MADERAVKKRFRLSLDISRPVSNREFTLVEGDTGNELIISLVDDGEPVDLTDCRVLALFSKSNGTTVSQDSGTEGNGVRLGGEAHNEVTLELFASSFAPGMVECELQVYSGQTFSTLVTSAKFNFRCRRGILNEDTVAALPEYPLLTSLIVGVNRLSVETLAMQAALAEALAAVEVGEGARSGAEASRAGAENARGLAELARAAAETARVAAEAARVAAEAQRVSAEGGRASGYAALAADLAAGLGSAQDLLDMLEAAVASLPGISTIAGILKGDGAGGVSAAVAGTDYAAPEAVSAKYDKPLRFTNTTINTSSWTTDSTYAGYTRRKTVALTGVTAAMVPDVVFAPAEVIGGNFAPVAVSYAGGIYLYAKAAPGASITIPTITLWKEV